MPEKGSGSFSEARENVPDPFWRFVFDLSKWGKIAPWLEAGSKWLGIGSVVVEGANGIINKNYAEVGHAGVDAGVLYGSAEVGGLLGGPVGLAIGLAWTGVDMLVQQYTYKGQTGWTALWHSTWDSQDQMQRQNPRFYQQLWAQPKE